MSIADTFCSSCGSIINPDLDTSEIRSPCSLCGAIARTINVSVSTALTVRDGMVVKAKRPDQKKPFVEDMSTASFSFSRKKLVHRHRLIDRDNDRYVERVTDYETGAVIHECDEPLSDHTGHGCVRRK